MSVRREVLDCPICFLIPEKEVYQCQNGHIICDKCIANLEQCPQCRVSIEGDKRSRCRVLEELLDNLNIKCPFSDRGCKIKMKRNQIADHKVSCKFGRTVALCKIFGGKNCTCDFTINMGTSADEIFTHLVTAHVNNTPEDESDLGKGEKGYLSHHGYRKFFEWEEKEALFSKSMAEFEPYNKCIVLTRIKDNYISWILLDLRQGQATAGANPQIFEISSDDIPHLSWKLPLIPIIEVEEYFNNPSIKTYIPYLKELRREANPNENNSNFSIRIKSENASYYWQWIIDTFDDCSAWCEYEYQMMRWSLSNIWRKYENWRWRTPAAIIRNQTNVNRLNDSNI